MRLSYLTGQYCSNSCIHRISGLTIKLQNKQYQQIRFIQSTFVVYGNTEIGKTSEDPIFVLVLIEIQLPVSGLAPKDNFTHKTAYTLRTLVALDFSGLTKFNISIYCGVKDTFCCIFILIPHVKPSQQTLDRILL